MIFIIYTPTVYLFWKGKFPARYLYQVPRNSHKEPRFILEEGHHSAVDEFRPTPPHLLSKRILRMCYFQGFLETPIHDSDQAALLMGSTRDCSCTSGDVVYVTMVNESKEVLDYDVIVFPQDVGRRRPTVEEWAELTQIRTTYNPRQKWIYAALSCPRRLRSILPPEPFLGHSFDWSMTYHSHSDISIPFGRFVKRPSKNQPKNWANSKKHLISWISDFYGDAPSNWKKCESLVDRLLPRLDVHKFKVRGSFKRAATERQWRQTMQQYKFHLSIEDDCCQNYVTKKFWQILKWNVVPIVVGAARRDYISLAPPNSFIFADDFESLDKLVDYIKLLDSNDRLYNNFFAWKSDFKIESDFSYPSMHSCAHACEILQHYDLSLKNESEIPQYFYPNVKWWGKSFASCGKHEWIRKFT